jgi:hypothetical protein
MSALVSCHQLAHGQHVEISTPQGPIQGVGWDPDKAGVMALRVVAGHVEGIVEPRSTLWLYAGSVLPTPIALLGCSLLASLPPGLAIAGCYLSDGIHVGLANVSDGSVSFDVTLAIVVL